ncbi:MAG: hypothetical protein V3T72_15355, partial [Thermoanaerobaculia bacterium]
LRTELLSRARAARRHKLELLEQGMLDLFQACGPQPDVEKDLEELAQSHQKVQRHHQQEKWLRRFKRAEDRFKGIAQNKQLELEARLRTRVATLRQKLEALRVRPLSDEVRQGADQLEHDVGELDRARGVEQILGGLRRAAEIEQDLKDLDRRARQDVRDLAAAQETLGERNAELQAEAARVDLALPDLEGEVEALAAGSEKLEAARQSAGRLDAVLEEQQRRLVERSRELLAAADREVREAAGALRLAGRPVPELDETNLPDDATPRHATAAVAERQELVSRLRDEAADAIDPLDERRKQLTAELEPMRLADLAPGDREDAEQLLAELDHGSWSLAEDALERLRLLARLVEKCELLFHRLKQDQLDAEQLLADLQSRLRDFNENQLRRYGRELTDRATALIYGVPNRPTRWLAVRRQLETADILLSRLERQATRLAARDVERAEAALRRRAQGAGGKRRKAAQELLAELGACGHDRLPPVTLRMRLLNAVPRVSPEG